MLSESEIQEMLGRKFTVEGEVFRIVCYIKQVDEPDFGCEGRPEKEPVYGTLRCVSENGQKVVKIEEKALWSSRLDDDMWICIKEKENAWFAFQNDWKTRILLEEGIVGCIKDQ